MTWRGVLAVVAFGVLDVVLLGALWARDHLHRHHQETPR